MEQNADARKAGRLQALLDRTVSRKDVPHAVMAVERGNGSFRWIGVAGAATTDGTLMRADTPFFIASIDKLFTATLVLQLYEAGRIAMDDPAGTYLPEGRLAGLHRFRGVDYTDKITVRHLLGHTSGLPDYIEDYPKGHPNLVERLVLGDFTWELDDMLRVVREQLSPHFPPQALGRPRTRVRYSDTNFVLLRAIIESVSGQDFPALLADRIFRRLELRRTFVLGAAASADRVPAPATLWAGAVPLDRPLALRALSSTYSTADDLIRFLRALMADQLFTSPATLGLMQQPWNRFGVPLDRAALRAPGWPIQYGLGMMRFELPRLLTPFRRVPAVIGHTGSTGSWLFHCPELDLFLAGTVDQVTAGALPYRIVPKMLRILMD